MNECQKYITLVAQLHESGKNDVAAEAFRKLLKEGREFGKIDWRGSLRLAKKYRALPKYCFRNCWLISKQQTDLTYYEGFACPVIPVEHAWLVDEKKGVAYDPSLALLGPCKGHWCDDYFGIAITDIETVVTVGILGDHSVPTWVHQFMAA